jgi:hypothetical protein
MNQIKDYENYTYCFEADADSTSMTVTMKACFPWSSSELLVPEPQVHNLHCDSMHHSKKRPFKTLPQTESPQESHKMKLNSRKKLCEACGAASSALRRQPMSTGRARLVVI